MQLSNTAYHVTPTVILIIISWTGTTAIGYQRHYLTM